MIIKAPRADWILALFLPMAVAAQALHSTEDIRRVAEQFVAGQASGTADARIHAVTDALDPRLRLPQCATRPVAALPPSARIAARVTVGVSCAQPKWTVYVPVRIETELPVLVLRQSLPASSAVSSADVEIQTRRVPGLAVTYISSADQLAGRHLKRAAAAGTSLTIDLLAADLLVRRGQRVTLIASVGGLEVTAQGEAIADATPSGRVRVLNLNSRRIVEGQVESRDRVRVSL